MNGIDNYVFWGFVALGIAVGGMLKFDHGFKFRSKDECFDWAYCPHCGAPVMNVDLRAKTCHECGAQIDRKTLDWDVKR